MRIWVRYGHDDSAMRAIYAGIRTRARRLDYECRLWRPVTPEVLIEGGWSPDGMILIGRSQRAERERRQLRLPGVQVHLLPPTRHERPARGWSRVRLDGTRLGAVAAEHLLGRGLQRFVLLNQGRSGNQRARSEGFVETLREAGYGCVDLVRATGHRAFDASDLPGPRRVVAWLKQQPRPFGLFATSDVLAELAVDWCRLAGVDVPQDAGVVGCGDDPLHAPDSSVTLSSVHLPYGALGRSAVDLLVDHIEGKLASRPPREVVLAQAAVTVRQSTAAEYSEQPLAREMITLVRRDRHLELGVDGLAERLGVSTATLYRYCRATLGISPSQYLQRVRVERAARLLIDSSTALVDIAQHCGFADQAAFTRAFKRQLGVTPGDFRSEELAGPE